MPSKFCVCFLRCSCNKNVQSTIGIQWNRNLIWNGRLSYNHVKLLRDSAI